MTFFAAATALERNPEVAAWLRDSIHEPCSHGWRWEEVWRLGRDLERQHVRWAIESFEETVGQRPLGWYCRYGPSVHTRELLVEEGGFVYDADAYNDDLPYFTEVMGKRHLIVPYSFTYNDARFVLPQGYGSPDDFATTLKRGFDTYLLGGGRRASPHDVHRPPPPASSARPPASPGSGTSSSTPSTRAASGSRRASTSPTGGSTTTRSSRPDLDMPPGLGPPGARRSRLPGPRAGGRATREGARVA